MKIDKLKSKIHELSNYHIELSSKESIARKQFSGAKVDSDKLVNFGFHIIESDDQGKWYASSSQSNGTLLDLLLFIGFNGFLRDVRFYKFDTREKLNSVRFHDADNEKIFFLLSEVIANCLIEDSVQTPIEEFERLRSTFVVTDEHAHRPYAEQLCMIANSRLHHYAENHKPTAARYVCALAKYSDFCRCGFYMSKAAFHAYELDMKSESWKLVNAAVRLTDSDFEPIHWSYLGHTLARHGMLDLSLECFLTAGQTGKNWDSERKSAWYFGKKWVEKTLLDKKFKDSFEYIDALLESREGVSNEDWSYMMVAAGLCYEGLLLMDEAAERYRVALEEWDGCRLARFGVNRIKSNSSVKKRHYFELQLQSFPRLPHELGLDNHPPVSYISGYSHGDHWSAVLDTSKYSMENLLIHFVKEGKIYCNAVLDPADVAASTAFESYLFAYPDTGIIRASTLVVQNNEELIKEMWSAYPFIATGVAVSLRIFSLEEWENGVEGSVVAKRGGGGSLTFFDPLFFVNKGKYQRNAYYQFVLSGFAHQIELCEPITYKIAEGPAFEMEMQRRRDAGQLVTPDDTFDVTIGEMSTILIDNDLYPGEYDFLLPVEGVDKIDFLGNIVFAIKTHINNEPEDIPLTIYTSERFFPERPPAKGNLIQGKLWLQGFRFNDEPVAIATPEEKPNEVFIGKLSCILNSPKPDQEQLIDAFNHALSNIKGVNSYCHISCRMPFEPDIVVEDIHGRRCFVFAVIFNEESTNFEKEKAKLLLKDSWIVSHFTPFFILGVGYKSSDNKKGLYYYSWNEFENYLLNE